MTIGFHASHEQFAPAHLLHLAQQAREAGFQALFCSDHFAPWSEDQAQSGFSFAWLGAAMQATDLPARTICCPFMRYHPAIVAQAAATLAQMFEGRFHLAIGSGQALNEHIVGQRWPDKNERNERLLESANILRALWAGETVTHRGHITVQEARLYTLPKELPMLYGAALTEATAAWMGTWADGLLTTSRPPEATRKIIHSFRSHGGENKPLMVKVGLCWDTTDARAQEQAYKQWRTNAFPSNVLSTLRTPAEFDSAAAHVRPADMHQSLRISSSAQQHVDWLMQDVEAGFTELHLHQVGTNQEAFIDFFGANVLPHLK